MKKVLQIIPSVNRYFGGIQSFLCSYYEHIDRSQVSFDFSFWTYNSMKMKMEEPAFREAVFTEYKAIVLHANPIRKITQWIVLFRAIRKQVKENKYDAVEVHEGFPPGHALCGMALMGTHVPVRISHSHSVYRPPTSWMRRFLNNISMKIIRKTYNAFFSCSDAAAKLYGEKIIHSDRFRIINNAIPVQAFSFRPDIRGKVRDQYDVDRDRVIIGHVARITIVKNQGFLVDVFYEFHKLVPNSSLWLIGDGECREEIEHRIREKHLEKDVRLFGERKDVPDLMQAMDACVFPSHTEGFCIAAVEAQAAGLPTLASTGLPDECEITGLLRRIELKEGALAWAKTLLSMISGYDRRETGNVLQKSKYDIETAAKELQRFYCGEKI